MPGKHLEKLTDFLNVPLDEFLVLWLPDTIRGIIADEGVGKNTLRIVLNALENK